MRSRNQSGFLLVKTSESRLIQSDNLCKWYIKVELMLTRLRKSSMIFIKSPFAFLKRNHRLIEFVMERKRGRQCKKDTMFSAAMHLLIK